MSPRDQIQITFDVLKALFKARGLSYKDVAKRAHMSESNLKRIFSTRTCSLDRLVEICSAVDLSIFDIMEMATKTRAPETVLSEAAERYFTQNFECFVFFRRLAGAKSPNDFLKQEKLPKEKIKKFLKDLERFGLIEIRAEKIHVKLSGYLRIPPDSPLQRKIEEQWVPWFFSQIFANRDKPEHQLKIASTGLSKRHRARFLEELNDLIAKYRDKGFVDQRLNSAEVSPFGIAIGIGPYRVGFF